MKASEIKNVVLGLVNSDSPYKCILIDGKWGIGKTYAVTKVKKEISNAVYISLFGIKTMEQIYIEVLSQICLSGKFERIKSTTKKIIRKMTQSKHGLISVASTILLSRSGIVSCLQAVCERKKNRTVNNRGNLFVIDDIERVDKSLDMNELFGFLDAIRTDTKYKLVLVANTEKILADNKTHFTEYSEKVIDRTYNITEVSSEVWENEGEFENEFVSRFWNKHHFSNLRTLQKAECLYKDVKAQIGASPISYKDNSVKLKFEEKVHLICYAVVFESVDKIYSMVAEQDDYKEFQSLMAEPDFRISHMYIGNATNEIYALVATVRRYFENNDPIDCNVLQSYVDFLNASKTKDAFYLSQEEISSMVDALVQDIRTKPLSTIELCEKANVAVSWMSVLEIDTSEVLKTVGEKIYKNETLSMFPPEDYSKPAYSTIRSICDLANYNSIREVLLEVEARIIEAYWKQLFEYCRKEITVHEYEDVLNILQVVREDINNKYHSDYIKHGIEQLLIPELAPVGSLEENAYACLHSLCYITNKINPSVMYNFLQKVADKFKDDKIVTHRINSLYDQFLAIRKCAEREKQ